MAIFTPGPNYQGSKQLTIDGDTEAKYTVREADTYQVRFGRLKLNYKGAFEYDADGVISNSKVSEFEVILNGKTFGHITGLSEPIQDVDVRLLSVTREIGVSTIEIRSAAFDVTGAPIEDATISVIQFPNQIDTVEPTTTTMTVNLEKTFSPYLSGADTMRGDAGDDRFMGFNGQDKLFGERGDDSLDGGKGRDVLSGGNGHDVLKGGAGADVLRGGNGKDQLDGGNGADKLRGGKGGDDLDGGLGHDHLWGGRGRDDLDGGQHDDVIHGGKGRDSLTGGAGTDRLTGGGGRDTFVFNEGDGADTVTDFLNGADLLDVSDFGFDSADDVLALASQDGTDTVIQLSASDKIILQDTDLADLNSLHFIV